MSTVDIRSSGAKKPNPQIRDDSETASGAALKSNLSWLRNVEITEGVLFLGGTSLAHFRARYAQSVMRRDLLPSFWSQVGILSDGKVLTVPLDSFPDISEVPGANGVQRLRIDKFDGVGAYPNIAIVRFAADLAAILRTAEQVSPQRALLDVPALIIRWLTYTWAIGGEYNPLLEGSGLPSARWLENVYSAAGIELAPGLASGASCPEAIWQAAKWWYEFYADADQPGAIGKKGALVPAGASLIRQPAAALLGRDDEFIEGRIGKMTKMRRQFVPM